MKDFFKTFGILFLGILAFVAIGLVFLAAADIIGVIAGIILSLALSYGITMTWLCHSNDAGDKIGRYEDFTDEPFKHFD